MFSSNKNDDKKSKNHTTDDWKFFMQEVKTNVRTSIDPTSVSKNSVSLSANGNNQSSGSNNGRPVTETDQRILRHHQSMVEEKRKKEAEIAAKASQGSISIQQSQTNLITNVLRTSLGLKNNDSGEGNKQSNSSSKDFHNNNNNQQPKQSHSLNRCESDVWNESTISEVSLQERRNDDDDFDENNDDYYESNNQKKNNNTTNKNKQPKFGSKHNYSTNRDTSKDASAIVFSMTANEKSSNSSRVDSGSFGESKTKRRKAQNFNDEQHDDSSTKRFSDENFHQNNNNNINSRSSGTATVNKNFEASSKTESPPLSMKDVKERAREGVKQAHEVAGQVASAMMPNPVYAIQGVVGVLNRGAMQEKERQKQEEEAYYSTRPTGLEDDYTAMKETKK